MSSEAVIEVRGLRLARAGRAVLTDIDLRVEPGDVIGLIGRNGSGKSSLLETLLGFHRPLAGHVLLWGQPVFTLAGGNKRRIAFVPQQDELIEGLTVKRQVSLISAFHPTWDEALAERLLTTWDLPPGRAIRHLSLGQRQRLSIVLAVAARPELLVLDEPVASLDPLARGQFLAELTSLVAGGICTLIFSSHIVVDLQALVNRVWILDAGRMRWQGRLAEIGDAVGEPGRPRSLEAVFLRLVS